MTWELIGPEIRMWADIAATKGGGALRYGVQGVLPEVLDRSDGDQLLTVPEAPPEGDQATAQYVLGSLQVLRWMQLSQKCEQTMLVAQARALGCSWSEIAERMGMSKQSVHTQYRALVEEFTAIVDSDQTSSYSESGGDLLEQVGDFVDHHFPEAWGGSLSTP